MDAYALSHVTDEDLLADLAALVATDRRTTAALLAHLAEVDARELFLPAACTSMHVYCVRVLRLADEVAYKRIRAARSARRHPQIFDAVADGRLHVTGVVVLAPHLTDENVDEVLAAAAYRSKAELEMLVARLAPKPDIPACIAPLDPQTSAIGAQELDPGPVPAHAETPARRVRAIAPERFALQCTITEETRDKLERLQALMRHRNPSGDLGEVIGRACDALITAIERERFAKTSRPRADATPRESEDPRHIPAEMKRAVYERDRGRCTFTSDCGERCGERGFVEIDHIVPVALGGQPTLDNLRLRCKPHNQFEAERTLGRAFMDAKREQARSKTDRGREVAESTGNHGTLAPITDSVEAELVDALTGLGYKSAEAQRAIASTADDAPATLEGRLRAALASLSRSRPIRCSDGSLDGSAGLPLSIALRHWRTQPCELT